MQPTILFIHSAGPQGENEGSGPLVAALRGALGSICELRAPLMPDPDNPSYAPWKDRLAGELGAIRSDVLLVGHSLGGSVLTKYLAEERCDQSIAGLFLVAAPCFGAPGWEHDEFMLLDSAAPALAAIKQVGLYYTRDDTVVPLEHMALYGRCFPQASAHELDGYGHAFSAGCDELVADIRALLG
jgi:uncharacterized protein